MIDVNFYFEFKGKRIIDIPVKIPNKLDDWIVWFAKRASRLFPKHCNYSEKGVSIKK